MSELQHHGILGQRWGKRNGPPYPLTASKHSSSEKKAGWRKSLKKTNSDRRDNKIQGENKGFRSFLDGGKELLNSEEFKKVMTVTAVSAGLYLLGKNINYRTFKMLANPNTAWGKALLQDSLTQMDDLTNHLDTLLTIKRYNKLTDLPKRTFLETDAFVDNINDGDTKSNDYVLRNKNCFICSTSVLMRFKGYNVSASGSNDGFVPGCSEYMFNGAKLQFAKSFTKKGIVKELKSLGDGSYGYMAVKWKPPYNFNHSMVYSIKNGKLNIFDGQVEEWYSEGSKGFNDILNSIKVHYTTYTDVTNNSPTDLVLKAVGTIR